MSLVFDHTKNKLSDCMGMPKEQIEQLHSKLARIAVHYDETDKKSYTAEKIAKELSYNELIFISIGYIETIINQHKIERPSRRVDGRDALNRLTNLIKKIKKDGENEN